MLIITTYQDNIVKIGESQKENQQIIDEANPTWIWFHADKLPSGHAIIETNKPTKQEIYQIANFVRERCKLKYYRKGTIIFCPVKNLKSTGVPGEVELKRRPKSVVV